MTFDLETLRDRLQAQGEVKRGRKAVWTPPEPDDFAGGWVLTFDQTLTKSGWALVTNNRLDEAMGTPMVPGLAIGAGGVLQPEKDEDLRSFEQTFAKAASMAAAIEEVMDHHLWVNVIVHEMPAVMGYRVESSLMAAREIRRLANRPWLRSIPVVMVSRQAAYHTLTGGAGFEKKQMTAAVERLIPKERRETTRWTQDTHDAVGLALKYLYEKKRAQA